MPFNKNPKLKTQEEKIKYLEQQKLTLVPESFCQGLPDEMLAYMNYVKSIQTNNNLEKIDYEYLRKMFKNLFNRHANIETFQYDWVSKGFLSF